MKRRGGERKYARGEKGKHGTWVQQERKAGSSREEGIDHEVLSHFLFCHLRRESAMDPRGSSSEKGDQKINYSSLDTLGHQAPKIFSQAVDRKEGWGGRDGRRRRGWSRGKKAKMEVEVEASMVVAVRLELLLLDREAKGRRWSLLPMMEDSLVVLEEEEERLLFRHPPLTGMWIRNIEGGKRGKEGGREREAFAFFDAYFSLLGE